MKQIELTKRLLWISDIHFRASYQSDTELKKIIEEYIKTFTQEIEKYIKVNGVFSYIILSGDIAFSGTKEDYKAFNNLFVDPLLKVIDENKENVCKSLLSSLVSEIGSFDKSSINIQKKISSAIETVETYIENNNLAALQPRIEEISSILENKTRILSIPGNHDTSREDFPSEWLYDASPKNAMERYNNRNKSLEKDIQKFTESFKDYQTTFYDTKVKNTLLPFRNQLKKTQGTYNGLYGSYVDDDLKIKFFMLNSAWYCLNAQQTNAAKSWETKNLIEIVNASQEFGGLIVGQNLIKDEVDKILNNNRNYRLITIVHHPPHWLHWGELYTYLPMGSKNFPLNKLLMQSDLILSGHQHLPISVPAEKTIGSNGYHVMTGQFLEDKIEASFDKQNFPHNRFSILELQENSVKEIRYFYSWDSDNIGKWNSDSEYTFNLEFDLAKIRLYDDEGKHFLELNATDMAEIVIRYWKNNEIDLQYDNNCKDREVAKYYSLSAKKNHKEKWIIVIPKAKNFFVERIKPIDDKNIQPDDLKFLKELKEAIKELHSEDNSLRVCIFCLDVLVGDEKCYLDKICDTEINTYILENIFSEIYEKSDQSFKIFRHNFFRKIGDYQPYNNLQEIELINITLPYWFLTK
jgi:Calcineurin-like phosphoesterase